MRFESGGSFRQKGCLSNRTLVGISRLVIDCRRGCHVSGIGQWERSEGPDTLSFSPSLRFRELARWASVVERGNSLSSHRNSSNFGIITHTVSEWVTERHVHAVIPYSLPQVANNLGFPPETDTQYFLLWLGGLPSWKKEAVGTEGDLRKLISPRDTWSIVNFFLTWIMSGRSCHAHW